MSLAILFSCFQQDSLNQACLVADIEITIRCQSKNTQNASFVFKHKNNVLKINVLLEEFTFYLMCS
jgi:hypothetical protein